MFNKLVRYKSECSFKSTSEHFAKELCCHFWHFNCAVTFRSPIESLDIWSTNHETPVIAKNKVAGVILAGYGTVSAHIMVYNFTSVSNFWGWRNRNRSRNNLVWKYCYSNLHVWVGKIRIATISNKTASTSISVSSLISYTYSYKYFNLLSYLLFFSKCPHNGV